MGEATRSSTGSSTRFVFTGGLVAARGFLWQEVCMVGRVGVLAGSIAVLGACGLFGGSSRPEPAPAPIEVVVVADARLNPDEMGRSLPTVVRLYQLKSSGKIEGADFDAIYRQPKEALGEDLLQADEITISPGDTTRRRLELDKSARAVAAVAVLRRPAGVSWRAVAELPSQGEARVITFAVEGYRIERR